MTISKLTKGLLGASALMALSTGTAFAQNAFTPADTTVSNSFTLDYRVGGIDQPQIETEDGPGPEDDNDPTTFKVDRLVNVTVASSGSTGGLAPGAIDAFVQFSVRNDGNDTHAYLLDFEEVANGTGAANDEFDTLNSTSGERIVYFVDTNADGVLNGTEGNTPITYDPADDTTWPVLAADESVIVRVVRNIPTSAEDGDSASIHLFADTRDTADPDGVAIVADADDNNVTDETENVLIDLDGPASAANDDLEDGAHSATNTYTVLAADLTATKDVFVFDEDYDGTCDTIDAVYVPPAPSSDTNPATPVPNNGYHRPDACVEYFITVRNDGLAAATDIDLTDVLSEFLIFESARAVGGLTGGTLSSIAANTSCDGTASTCNVTLTGATLAGKANAGDPPVEGHLIIRTTIK